MSNSHDVKLSSNYILLHPYDQHDVVGPATVSNADIYIRTYNAILPWGSFFIPENVVAIIIFDYENDPVIKEDPPGTK